MGVFAFFLMLVDHALYFLGYYFLNFFIVGFYFAWKVIEVVLWNGFVD